MPQAFKKEKLNLSNGQNISTKYQVGDFFADENVTALTSYEIARRLQMQPGSVEHHFNLVTVADLNPSNKDELEAICADLVKNVREEGKPTLLTVSNNFHFVSIALLPDPVEQGKVHVIYTNSAANTTEENLEDCRTVGLELAKKLNKDTGNKDEELHQIKINPSQQIVNNCGAQTAFNHATIAEFYEQRKVKGKERKLNMNELRRMQENQVGNRIASIPNEEKRIEEFNKLVRTKFTAMEKLESGHIIARQDLPHNYLKELHILENKYLTGLQQKHTKEDGQIDRKAMNAEQVSDDYKLALKLQKEELQAAGHKHIKTEADVVAKTKASWQKIVQPSAEATVHTR